jgi:hypothetical protein
MSAALAAMSPDLVASLRLLQKSRMELPQEPIRTEHILHAGMYVRTVRIPPGIEIIGCTYKVPTMLIVHGVTMVFTGDSWVMLEGHHVIPADSGRKQIFYTLSDTVITMIFATKAQTIEDAENEFTDEADCLMSRRAGEFDSITITGG